jgi:hypothetical protein
MVEIVEDVMSSESSSDILAEIVDQRVLLCDDIQDIIEENDNTDISGSGTGANRCTFELENDDDKVLKVARRLQGFRDNMRASNVLTLPRSLQDRTFARPEDKQINNVSILQEKVDSEPERVTEDDIDTLKDKLDEATELGVRCDDFGDPENVGFKGNTPVLTDLGECRLAEGQRSPERL